MTDLWTQHTRRTLQRYDESLLRQVAHKLCKPRNQWPVDELLDRVVSALDNAAMVDRRLKEMPKAARRILCVIGHSRQTRWPLGSLVEILVALGESDGLAPLVALLEAGLLLPELIPFGFDPGDDKISARSKLKHFDTWLGRSDPMPMLLASPTVTRRVLKEDLGIECPVATANSKTVQEADGLDWPLRLAVLWQQVLDGPLRRTQQGDFFKRDFDRLQADPLLSAAPNDVLAEVADPGFFAAALAQASGLLREEQAELKAGSWTDEWKSLPQLCAAMWSALLRISSWNPATGHAPGSGNPYAAAYMLTMLLLSRLPENAWTDPQAIEDWIAARHPFWHGATKQSVGISRFLLGIAYSLRLIQAAKADNSCVVRLSPIGRWVMGLTEQAPTFPSFKQTLLVQPNLEVLAYRQGLTPELIAGLSRVATWKSLGAACTLQLEPHSVYRALEMGESLATVTHLLEGHSMKAMPTAVLDSLKTWSNKRERITIYAAGAIFEFATPEEMNEAFARGLPAARLTDRLAVVANESDIDYKHFRLTGTRDYTLPPERCVEVDPDGVTLSVDLARSDLLLETELEHFTASIDNNSTPGRRLYRITPASILSARQQGATLASLETWFIQRTGLPISAAAQLLMTGADIAAVELRRQLVLRVGNEHLADGLQQWPATRDLVHSRLGPTVLAVEEKNVPALTERLKELGVKMLFEG